MKKILVTGGLGFIGYHLTKRLLGQGYTVDIVDNFSRREYSRKNFEELNELDDVLIFDYDITDDTIWFELDTDYDCIFHLAALPRVQYSFDNIAKTTFHNCVGTANVVEFCRKYDIRVVFASSSTAIKKISPYGQQKAYCEELIESCLDKYTIARLFSVYGTNMDTSGNYTLLIPELIDCALTGRTFNLYGDGSKKRDFTYVDDVSIALMDLITYSDDQIPLKIDIGNSQPRSIIEAINIVQEATGKKISINFNPGRKEEEVTKANNRWLGMLPLEQGIKLIVEENNK